MNTNKHECLIAMLLVLWALLEHGKADEVAALGEKWLSYYEGEQVVSEEEFLKTFEAWEIKRRFQRLQGEVLVVPMPWEKGVQVRGGDGKPWGELRAVEGGKYGFFAKKLKNFAAHPYEIVNGEGKILKKGQAKLQYVPYDAESKLSDAVPQGKVMEHRLEESKVFPNTNRDYLIYVPQQYDAQQGAGLMVFQDGLRHADPQGNLRATVVMDHLIHSGKMPVTIGLFINPGRLHSQKPEQKKSANRSLEYDTVSDAYVNFLLQEMVPKVEESYKLIHDPKRWAIAGGSSGGICAWNAAWHRPDKFGKVLCWVGTFVDIRGGHAYPRMVRKEKAKPIRGYFLAGTNDLDNQFGNWPLANRQMEAALQYAGYDQFHYEWTECFHGSVVMGAYLPRAMKWLWEK